MAIGNGNRNEWSPIRSVITRVITKSDYSAAGVRFVYHEYDYRPNWTTRRKGKICIKSFTLILWWLKPRMWLVDLNYNFEGDWLIELSDNKLSDNKVSDNNLTSDLVENRSFLNQSQSRKLWFLWLALLLFTYYLARGLNAWGDVWT